MHPSRSALSAANHISDAALPDADRPDLDLASRSTAAGSARPGHHRGPLRPEVAQARRVVIKLGTRVLVDDQGRLMESRLAEVVSVAAALHQAGHQVMLVSSGAVCLGRLLLDLPEPPENEDLRRACAAVGQGRLMGLYERNFAARDLVSAQVLLTEEDFGQRHRYLDLRSTLERLLEARAVPILNENDVVAHGLPPAPSPAVGKSAGARARRRVFTDNDRLAALVAAKCHADLLVLLTDVDGVYDRDPHRFPEAELVERIEDPERVLASLDDAPGSSVSRGGMRSKVEAARVAVRGGCHAVIACGRRAGVLERVMAGLAEGTYFPALGSLPARRRWIAYAATARGVLHLDAGAVRALCERRASLLPVGVAAIEGRFDRGDVVELRGPEGELVGRGLMSYDAEEARRWCAGYPPGSAEGRHPNCLLRRTHVVLERRAP